MEFLNHIKKLDWILIISSFLLVGIGILSIYSSSFGRGDFSNFYKQIVFFGIGVFLMFLISFFDYRILKNDSYLILIFYFLNILALVGLLFLAPEIRGTRSWYKLGPVSFDPIEFTKIILMILLAKYFSMRHIEINQIKHIILSGAYVILPVFLIFLQPDLGSALIILSLWIIVLIISGIKMRHFLMLIFLASLIFVLGWSSLLKDYQKERILSFVYPQEDPLGASWSQNQAKIAIGSGGIWGQGIGNGSQTQYGFLPETQTDFIFASIAEETGLIGISFLFLLFSVILLRTYKIILKAKTNFARLFIAGFGAVLITQVFINIGMNIGIAPIIGISLPLVSYGGSSLILTFIGLGIIQSINLN